MTKLTEIMSGIAIRGAAEAEPVTDIPLGPREPAPARNVEIASRVVLPRRMGRPAKARVQIDPGMIEPIPQGKAEIAPAKPQGRTQEDYYKAVRQATRRPTGFEPVSQERQSEIASSLIGQMRRKDQP